jgi:hypothetical protein
VTRKDDRPQAGTIGEYIEQAREKFDLNAKIEFIIDEYLQYDTEDFYFDEIAYPTHIEKGYAYEAGYINSDGYDLIVDQETFPDPVRKPTVADTEVELLTDKIDYGDTSHPGFQKQNNAALEEDASCNIPTDRAVPILQWPEAFKCWLEKTLEKPVEFELEIEIDRSSIEGYGEDLENWKDNAQIR